MLWQNFQSYGTEMFYDITIQSQQNIFQESIQGIEFSSIHYTLVIVSDLYLYELVVPQAITGVPLQIYDKINVPKNWAFLAQMQFLGAIQTQYDNSYYYICIDGLDSQALFRQHCLKIKRH